MHRLTRTVLSATTLAALALGATACGMGDSKPDAQENENKSRQSTYEKLVANQPAATMDYSPTRATKNKWVERWDEKGKLAYVYLMTGAGDIVGYYVTVGLPVSYCTSLVPPYKVEDYRRDGEGNAFAVPGPSVDGTYSSSSNCNTYYGFDATSDAYIEYTAGMGLNPLIFDQPLPVSKAGDAIPLGDTEIKP